jgi:hypothetical protein
MPHLSSGSIATSMTATGNMNFPQPVITSLKYWRSCAIALSVSKRARSSARGNEVLSGHREICSHYLRTTECECRPGSKCALVSAIFVGRLATLHLHHFSTVFGGSAGREWVLHSKLHVPAFLATHSAAVVPSFSPILLFSLYSASHFTAEQLTTWPNCRCPLWVISGH